MPICITCTTSVPQLYTVYGSEENSRLEQCPKCTSFADPYVEFDTFSLVLDLILLRRGVFRHLVFNRGSLPKRVFGPGAPKTELNVRNHFKQMERERQRNILIFGSASILADSFTRWIYYYPLGKKTELEMRSWDLEAGHRLLITILGCFLETASFHIGVTTSSILVLRLLNWMSPKPPSSVRSQVRASHISLTLLYSSFTKLFMLLALSIWHPENISLLPQPTYSHPLLKNIIPWLDVDQLDRRWVARNVLGGTTSSFGLKVALECNPSLIILIIIAGWAIKTWVSSLASEYLGSQASHMDDLLLYALP